jgi:hypothetical protein
VDWIPAVYAELCAAGRGESLDIPTLNRVFDSYRADECEVQTAFGEFRKYVSGVRYKLGRPVIAKAALELQAAAHLRKGTWA